MTTNCSLTMTDDQKRKAKTPEEIAEFSGGDIDVITAAFRAVRIIRGSGEDDDRPRMDGNEE